MRGNSLCCGGASSSPCAGSTLQCQGSSSALECVATNTAAVRLQVLGLRHQGALQAHPAAGESSSAAGIWAARHSLHCRVVDEEAAGMLPVHPPVQVSLIG